MVPRPLVAAIDESRVKQHSGTERFAQWPRDVPCFACGEAPRPLAHPDCAG
ncbi:MAG TPA: hypothetical protein VFX20_22085 [Steroidobacteraceae bacterium]|nr:hypothetical protein [Steroidobacteraceae bacterium]